MKQAKSSQPNESNDQLLTVHELAELLHKTWGTIRRLIRGDAQSRDRVAKS